MNHKEAAIIIGKISLLDRRIGAATKELIEGMAQAWAEVLDHSMPLEWALEHVLDHYKTNTTTVMPANLNLLWRSHRAIYDNPVALPPAGTVPMPQEIRQQFHAILQQKSVDMSAAADKLQP